MNEVDKELVDLHTEGEKKFRIIGIPERVIKNDIITYRLPVKMISENDIEESNTKYLSISEEELMEMLNLARGYFDNESANVAYT